MEKPVLSTFLLDVGLIQSVFVYVAINAKLLKCMQQFCQKNQYLQILGIIMNISCKFFHSDIIAKKIKGYRNQCKRTGRKVSVSSNKQLYSEQLTLLQLV